MKTSPFTAVLGLTCPLGLTVALFQGSPAQGQTETGSTFQVVPTPNENPNSELFAASASSPNDIWAVGQSAIHFDGTTWMAFPAPMIKGDNNSFLQGGSRYFSDFGLGGGKRE
jgi:hypothetical protein